MEEDANAKKKKITIILLVVVVIIYGGIFFLVERNDRKKASLSASIVTDYSEFFTVNSCISKYFNYLGSKDEDALYKLLSADYKRKKIITKENVLMNLSIVASGSSFAAQRIYKEKVREDIYKYYVYGFIEVGGLEIDDVSRTEDYIIVYLDKKNTLFSIEPYDGKEYKEGAFK